jgi:mono/diheme cytochrome c family protein
MAGSLEEPHDRRGGVSGPIPRAVASALLFLFVPRFFSSEAFAQETPYVVTYDHHLEEPGNLEVEYFSTFATQRAGNDFHSYWIELEYGAAAWWTTELYLDAQTTFRDSTLFTGFRWENRIRPLRTEHFINPVIYIEYETISEADKIIKEVEGHDVESDHADLNAVLRKDNKREFEFKLILGKDFKGWNFALNPIATKNLSPNNPWEFGYALGISRPLALKASAKPCTFCRENFIAGVELYGGLGDTQSFGLHETSHYVAPAVAWISPFGLDSAAIARIRVERQQPSHSIAMGFFPGILRLRRDPLRPVRRPLMKMNPVRIRFAALVVLAGATLVALDTSSAQISRNDEPADVVLARVPEKARVKRNPFENDPEAARAGKKLFEQHCAECHGKTAGGTKRGPSLHADALQQATPGEIFWVVTNGVVRRGMPAWSKLPEPQRWQVVAFLRGLADSWGATGSTDPVPRVSSRGKSPELLKAALIEFGCGPVDDSSSWRRK